MVNELRIRGQEVQIRLTKDSQLMRTITAIENLTFTVKMDILRKGYTGETTDRRGRHLSRRRRGVLLRPRIEGGAGPPGGAA
jgi:hypothetical protein